MFTEAMREWLNDYIPGHHHAETSEEFNKVFGVNTCAYDINNYAKRNKVRNGFTGRYEKGHVAHNKGKKMPPEFVAKTAKTQFKKGDNPHNMLPVGSIIVDSSGYKRIKVGLPNKWERYAHHIWEQYHGPVPKGYNIIHLNGIITDDRIENLDILSNAELARYNKSDFRGKSVEINQVLINIARLKEKTSKKQKKTGENQLSDKHDG